MSSLDNAIKVLESDLKTSPMRIAAHSDMPFAIFRYSPLEEFNLRKHLRLLSITLKNECGRHVSFVSLSRLVWETVDLFGEEDLYNTEKLRGFNAAQRHINQLLTSRDFKPAEDSVLEKISGLNPARDMVFLVRAGGFAPGIYRTSILLDMLHNRTSVPSILFFPGSAEAGTDLRFFDIPIHGGLGVYNYRVRIYGGRS